MKIIFSIEFLIGQKSTDALIQVSCAALTSAVEVFDFHPLPYPHHHPSNGSYSFGLLHIT